MQSATGVIIKDIYTGWEDFTQEVVIIVKVQKLPEVQEQHYWKYINSWLEKARAIANTLNIPVSTSGHSRFHN